VKLIDVASFILGDTGDALQLLTYAVLALLAIGCINIAGLLFARGVRLQKEVAVRSALGAGRAVLIRQFLAENVIYAVAGGMTGAALAYVLIRATSTLLIASLSRGTDVHVNMAALGASLAIAMVTSLVAGLLPAGRLSDTSTDLALRSGARTASKEHIIDSERTL